MLTPFPFPNPRSIPNSKAMKPQQQQYPEFQDSSSSQSAPLLLPQSHHPQQPYIGIGIPVNDPQPTTATALILLPRRLLRRSRRHRCCTFPCCSSSSLLTLSFVLLLLALSIFLLFPSDPQISVARLHLHSLRLAVPTLDINLSLTIKIRNPDFFSLDYDSLNVSIAYRGKPLGFVTSDGGRIRARGVSYVEARLKLKGVSLVSDLIYLVEDIAKGSIPFDTVTEVEGVLNVIFLPIPVDVSG